MQRPKQEEPAPTPAGLDEDVFWKLVIQNWRRAVAPDLHHEYGMDDGDPAFWLQPFWRLRERVMGLLDRADSRLWHVVSQAREHPEQEGHSGAPA